MFAVRKAASYSGSTPDRTFQRIAISGNSFTYSQKLLRRFQWLKRSSAGKPGKHPKDGDRNGGFNSLTQQSGAC